MPMPPRSCPAIASVRPKCNTWSSWNWWAEAHCRISWKTKAIASPCVRGWSHDGDILHLFIIIILSRRSSLAIYLSRVFICTVSWFEIKVWTSRSVLVHLHLIAIDGASNANTVTYGHPCIFIVSAIIFMKCNAQCHAIILLWKKLK